MADQNIDESLKQLFKYLERDEENILIEATNICQEQSTSRDICKKMIPAFKSFLKLSSSPNQQICLNTLNCLINITSNYQYSIQQFITLKAVSRILDSILVPLPICVHEKLMFLSNLTTETDGALQLLDFGDKQLEGQRLLRLSVRFISSQNEAVSKTPGLYKGLNIITSGSIDEYEYAALVLMNSTLILQGRTIFYQNPDFFMPNFLSCIFSENPIRKQGIIGVIRNLCFDENQHQFLLEKVKILPYVLIPLAPKSIEDNLTAYDMITQCFSGFVFNHFELIPDNRKHLLETILLLTQSEFGKDFCQKHHVVFVMRELIEAESFEESKQICYRIGARLLPEDELPDCAPPNEGNDID
jgi:hypothetical protein